MKTETPTACQTRADVRFFVCRSCGTTEPGPGGWHSGGPGWRHGERPLCGACEERQVAARRLAECECGGSKA